MHFENANIEDKNIDDGTITIGNDTVTITSTGTFEKPGDYINTSFYVMNTGTMDAQLNTFSVSGITSQLSNYFNYSLKYDNGGTNVARGDILRAGQGRKINLHIEYKYDVEELSAASNLALTITMNYINPKKIPTTTIWDYEFTNTEQYFIANKTGTYKLEVWGAQGANRNGKTSGFGGYSTGRLALQKNEKIYINVGGQGTDNCTNDSRGSCKGGYNGGGNSYFNSGERWGSGGGATHIAKTTGILSSLSPNTNGVGDIIIVAGGTGEVAGTFGQGGNCPAKNCTRGGGGYYRGAAGYAVCGSGGQVI